VLARLPLGRNYLLRENHGRRRARGVVCGANIVGDSPHYNLDLAVLGSFRDSAGGEIRGPELPVVTPYGPGRLMLIACLRPDDHCQGGGLVGVGD